MLSPSPLDRLRCPAPSRRPAARSFLAKHPTSNSDIARTEPRCITQSQQSRVVPLALDDLDHTPIWSERPVVWRLLRAHRLPPVYWQLSSSIDRGPPADHTRRKYPSGVSSPYLHVATRPSSHHQTLLFWGSVRTQNTCRPSLTRTCLRRLSVRLLSTLLTQCRTTATGRSIIGCWPCPITRHRRNPTSTITTLFTQLQPAHSSSSTLCSRSNYSMPASIRRLTPRLSQALPNRTPPSSAI